MTLSQQNYSKAKQNVLNVSWKGLYSQTIGYDMCMEARLSMKLKRKMKTYY